MKRKLTDLEYLIGYKLFDVFVLNQLDVHEDEEENVEVLESESIEQGKKMRGRL